MRHCHHPLILLTCALLGAAGAQVVANPAAPFVLPATVRIPATPPRPARYCTPVAYRDYEVLIGRAVFVQPVEGCKGPVRLRKISDITGQADPPLNIYAPTSGDFPARVWLFISHLEYTLDGSLWTRLRLIP